MDRTTRLMRSWITAALLASLASVAAANITIGFPPPVYVPMALGPPDNDIVQLAPDPPVYQPARGIGALLASQEVGAEYGQVAGLGNALNGTLRIDVYRAFFSAPHVGAAQLKATYIPGAGDPPVGSLRWIQIVSATKPGNGAEGLGPSYVDPPAGLWIDYDDDDVVDPNETQDNHPFYWNEGLEHTRHIVGGNYVFDDSPQRPCQEHPSFQQWRADLMLASVTPSSPGGPLIITIHDGITWGFDLTCVPEPSAVILLILGAMIRLRRR